jgi:hypothetical protein
MESLIFAQDVTHYCYPDSSIAYGYNVQKQCAGLRILFGNIYRRMKKWAG